MEAAPPSARARPNPSTRSSARPTVPAASPASGPSFPILGYDDSPPRRCRARIKELSQAGAPQGADLRAQARQPQVGGSARWRRRSARRGRSVAGLAANLDASMDDRTRRAAMLGAWTAPETRLARPQRGDELELTIDSLAFGGAGVARMDGYVVFVPAPSRAIRPGGRSASASAPTPRHARSGAQARPGPDRAGGRSPGSSVAGAALRAPARGQGRAGGRGAAADRQARRLHARSRSSRRSSSGATATSSSTRSAPTPTRAPAVRLPCPRPWDRSCR